MFSTPPGWYFIVPERGEVLVTLYFIGVWMVLPTMAGLGEYRGLKLLPGLTGQIVGPA